MTDAPSLPPLYTVLRRTGAARRGWIVTARAVGGHARQQCRTEHQQPCAEYARLNDAERDAWDALELARRAAP